MALLRTLTCGLAVLLLVAPTLAAICPDGCVCSTTRDGLHRATCSNLAELYKFTMRQKHHNINILDLSHNNITKLNHELDRLTEVVGLDLSTNGIQNLNKFLHNAKKLVHLNLANNRIRELSLSYLPKSISSLDLTNNLLHGVPTDLQHLVSLEHLELEGNPIDCSCENLIARDRLLSANVFIDNVKCVLPLTLKGLSWLELKTKDICKTSKLELNYLDMMMGDQPIDAVQVGKETTALKSMPLVASNDLEEGKIIQAESLVNDDDNLQFLKVGKATSSSSYHDIEGSGEAESTTISDIYLKPKSNYKLDNYLTETDEVTPFDDEQTTVDPIDGSGEGSGFVINYDDHSISDKTTTPVYEGLNTERVHPLFPEEFTTEFPIPTPPNVYEGGQFWTNGIYSTSSTERPLSSSTTRDTTVSEQIIVTRSQVLGQVPASSEKTSPHKTGTYVCIAIIVILLVGLIGFAIIKGQMRKRRDRRLIRQQKRDVEKASKEMVDMNKSLLGKPATVEDPIEKKSNGKYELVPTHEVHQKKSENGDVANGINHDDSNGLRTDSLRDTNQNKSSSRDNNLTGENTPQQETSFESAPATPNLKKDNSSMSSEDFFVPLNEENTPRLNGNFDSNISHPHINGDQNTDSDLLSPSLEYVPVYSPDMGRVRIKMTETPKPKTPVLVTRSRSNAGDIVITPSGDLSVRKSTT